MDVYKQWELVLGDSLIEGYALTEAKNIDNMLVGF